MKRLLLSALCLVAVLVVGCDSGSSTTTSSQFTGSSTPVKSDAPPPNVPGEMGQTPSALVPPGAPPEASKMMQGMMSGASGMPKTAGGAGSVPPGGAPTQPPAGNP